MHQPVLEAQEAEVLNSLENLSLSDKQLPNNPTKTPTTRKHTPNKVQYIRSPSEKQVSDCTAAGILLFTTKEKSPGKKFIHFFIGMGKNQAEGWQHFGGKIEREDTTIEACALREFQEETYQCLDEDSVKLIKSQLNREHSFYLPHCKQLIFLAYLQEIPPMESFKERMSTSEKKDTVDFKLDDFTCIKLSEMRRFFGQFVKKTKKDLIIMAKKMMTKESSSTDTPHFKFENKAKR